MAKRTKQRSKGPILALVVILSAALGIRFLWTSGRSLPRPGFSFFSRPAGGLKAFADSLEKLKDDSLSLKRIAVPADSGIRYQLGAGRERSYVLLNLRLNRAAKVCGLKPVEAREDSRKQTLDLIYSAGDTQTVHVLVKRKKAEPPAIAPRPQLFVLVYDWPPRDPKTAQEFLNCPQAATLIIKAGIRETPKSILVALPLEPKGYPRQDPGPGTILVDDSDLEIKAKMDRALKQYPRAAGFCAVAGSRALEDSRVCTQVLKYCLQRDLLFMEPQPSSRSLALELAGQLGCRYLRPDLTIGSQDPRSSVTAQLVKALAACRDKGRYVLLAPASPVFIKVLKETAGERTRAEFEFPPASKIRQ